ncbi:glycerol-3-phosphate dehydrogenase/oxidase [Luteipulveratus flavus]|uniref:Glycerol-3-phosphate dehydrogenase n=1 Tax=Luteipulveratus flavus TaxID=3031728 RepID=A0ABT6CCI3_9MICO|nr:glycerol-3-phosphate dehydrogenase/oxidase [Luteipulveratus sp. YIM 133296]MDF8266087.1 glycerol-3-phosphate dehydrogenase/oxidase [Luteipulveratus sp. YIM 133296]
MSASLNAPQRARALRRLAEEEIDVLVVGGGVTGAGIALDAATRGWRTVLVERHDLACGTSRWSSKLVHGGLRYLSRLQLGIARESAVERHHLLTAIAPHLVRPARTLVPFTADAPRRSDLALAAGIRVADGLRLAARTPARVLPGPYRVTAHEACSLTPALAEPGLRGGVVYSDGQLEDDARLVVAVARTAAAHGADVITRAGARDLTGTTAVVTDELTGERTDVRARVVVNATGAWAADLDPRLALTPSRGSHLVVRSSALGHPTATLSAPVPGEFGRFVIAIPQPDGLTYIGLTDEPAPDADPEAPPVPPSDETFLLSTLNRLLATPLTAADVVGRFAGLRPLVGGGDRVTADISRRHLLLDEPDGPVTIVGGKLTTYRRMAQDTVDAVGRRLGSERPCVTADLGLVGSADRVALQRVAAPTRLVRRYGTEAPAVDALARRHPELARPVADGSPTIGAELLFGVLHEAALDTADLVERRTRVSMVDADVAPAREAASAVLDLAATTAG